MRTFIVSLFALFLLVACVTMAENITPSPTTNTQGEWRCPYSWDYEAPEYSAALQAFRLATDWQKPEWDRAEVARTGIHLLAEGRVILHQIDNDQRLRPMAKSCCTKQVRRDRAEAALILANDVLTQGEYEKIPGFLYIVLQVAVDPDGRSNPWGPDLIDQVMCEMAKDLGEVCMASGNLTVRQYCQIAVLNVMEMRSMQIGMDYPSASHSNIVEWREAFEQIAAQNLEPPSQVFVRAICRKMSGQTLLNRYAGPKTRAFAAKWCAPAPQAQP